MPRPPGAPPGFGFPSIAVTMATIALGFFAVLVARALPGRRRVWPYVVGGALVSTIGFARLYLGAHWLSDIVGGALLGISWLLALGIAYRSHVSRPLDMRPLALAFYGVLATAGAWHADRAAAPLQARFEAPAPARTIAAAAWWDGDGWRALPARRNERSSGRRWPLDLQVAGPLERVRAALAAHGWREQRQADWLDVLGLLDDDRPPAAQAVLPATLDAAAETLLMRRRGPGDADAQVLHLWRAPATLGDGSPLWLGSAQAMHYTRVRDALSAFPVRTGEREGIPVLRVDARAAARRGGRGR
jgi:hypothetical protein